MNKKVNIFNIPIDAITIQETLERVEKAIGLKEQIHHTVVNAGKIVHTRCTKGAALHSARENWFPRRKGLLL